MVSFVIISATENMVWQYLFVYLQMTQQNVCADFEAVTQEMLTMAPGTDDWILIWITEFANLLKDLSIVFRVLFYSVLVCHENETKSAMAVCIALSVTTLSEKRRLKIS